MKLGSIENTYFIYKHNAARKFHAIDIQLILFAEPSLLFAAIPCWLQDYLKPTYWRIGISSSRIYKIFRTNCVQPPNANKKHISFFASFSSQIPNYESFHSCQSVQLFSSRVV